MYLKTSKQYDDNTITDQRIGFHLPIVCTDQPGKILMQADMKMMRCFFRAHSHLWSSFEQQQFYLNKIK
jgi:hypothetical protein